MRDFVNLVRGPHCWATSAMKRADEYRKRAKDAEDYAERTVDSVIKQAFREVARQWREMAEQAERNGW